MASKIPSLGPDGQMIVDLEQRIADLERQLAEARKKIALYAEYTNLLTDELTEVVPLAATHGWKSTRFEEGRRLREALAAMAEEEKP